MYAKFERVDLHMTRAQAESAAHAGRCDEDVESLATLPQIARQLRRLDPDAIRAELREYGAWDASELADDEANQRRLVWLGAASICDR